jgi:hypothetical protein
MISTSNLILNQIDIYIDKIRDVVSKYVIQPLLGSLEERMRTTAARSSSDMRKGLNGFEAPNHWSKADRLYQPYPAFLFLIVRFVLSIQIAIYRTLR